jgi:hypothetical protein
MRAEKAFLACATLAKAVQSLLDRTTLHTRGRRPQVTLNDLVLIAALRYKKKTWDCIGSLIGIPASVCHRVFYSPSVAVDDETSIREMLAANIPTSKIIAKVGVSPSRMYRLKHRTDL